MMKTFLTSVVGAVLAAVPFSLSLGIATPWVERIGWTLIHSVWQLSLLAVVAVMVNRSLKHRSANARYIAAVTCFSLMAIAPLATWAFTTQALASASSALDMTDSPAVAGASSHSSASESNPTAAEESVVSGSSMPKFQRASGVSVAPNATAAGSRSRAEDPLADSRSQTQKSDFASDGQHSMPLSTAAIVVSYIEPKLPSIVRFWVVGILVCSIRPIWSLWAQWHLRRRGLSAVPESIQSMMTRLAVQIGLTKDVRVAQSTLVKVPMVFGYLRPVILMPASVITGLTATQLEAVLAHELAHVRRHDWLINAFQVMVETLLFYHPAVWWLSKCIRQERELCCDDIALSLNIDKAVYARMLLTLEELRQKSITPALAATGGDLAQRVRRLLPVDSLCNRTPRYFGDVFPVVIVFLTIIAAVSSATLINMPEQGIVTILQKTSATVEGGSAATEGAPNNAKDSTQEAAAVEQPVQNKQLLRSIHVLDESEQPIAGAEVRFQFRHSGDTLFPIDAMESKTTDAQGIAKIETPTASKNVHITINAEGFGKFSETQQPTGNSIVRLKRGRVIHVRAVDEAGNVLRKAVPLLEQSRTYGREFVAQEDGTFKSPAVDMDRRLMRVVTAQLDGPMLFSDLVDVATIKPGEDGIAEIVLKPGTMLTGRLEDSVPRPISEGYVDLMVVEGSDHILETANNRFQTGAWGWKDTAPVQPDGTFTFESVPSGGVAQIHVVVDGYMSVNPPLEDLAAIIQTHARGDETTLGGLEEHVGSRAMLPYLVPVNQPTADITVKCMKTASCDFRILDPAGNPVPDAAVNFSPNGIFINGALFVPGSTSFLEASLVHELFHGVPAFAALNGHTDDTPRGIAIKKEREWAVRSFLGVKSDADGQVEVRNLPGGTRENFRITAKGFVLPHSPLYPGYEDRREGYIDLIAGETVEATIYLEREQPVIEREILLVDDQGNPLPEATIALTEMRVGSKDWQMWSSQRFGTLQSATTDENGRVVLSAPSQIGDTAVERLRLAVNYREDNSPRFFEQKPQRIWMNGALVDIPLQADGGLVAVARNPDPSRPSRAVYGKLGDILNGINSNQLLKTMIERPGLAILRQLLSASNKPYPEPFELLDSGRFVGDSNGVRVSIVPAGDSSFALVSAKVRPLNGTRSTETDMSRLPECVFVFDSAGQLVASLGGEIGTTGAGSPDTAQILNLGPAEDWFVRVTRFQQNGAFEYQSVYYRIGDSVIESLRYYHYPGSNSWSNGPEKVPRHGVLYFELPGQKNKFDGMTVGLSPDGVALNGLIVWDGNNNQFFGATSQTVGDRLLYKVDSDWSKEFKPLTPKPNQMILSGGARAHDHWYGWDTVVPEGFEATVRVTIPQLEGNSKTLEQKLPAGRHMIQFQEEPNQDGQTFTLQLGYGDDQEIQKADLPHAAADLPADAAQIVNVTSEGESVRLVHRSLKNSPKALTLDVTLQTLKH